MARTWDNKLDDIANINMMIAGASGQGGSPGQSYQRPLQNPDPGEAVFGVEKGGQTFFEFLKAMGIDPANNIRKTGGPLTNDDSYGENETPGRPGWQISGIPEFDSFMDRFKKGSPTPKFPSLNHHSPEAQKLILSIGKRLRAQLPANSRTNFRPLGWRTDYTGSFRVEDDGKLKPQLYLHKIKA